MNTLERLLHQIEVRFESDAVFERTATLTPRTVSNWKSGKSESFLKMLPRLATLLGTTSAYLLCETDDPAPAGEKKEPATIPDDGLEAEIMRLLRKLPPERLPEAMSYVEWIASRGDR